MRSKSDHDEDMSMEEILASIRRFVTDNPPEEPQKQQIYKGDLTESVVVPPAAPLHHSQRPPEPLAPPPFPLSEPPILELRNPISSLPLPQGSDREFLHQAAASSPDKKDPLPKELTENEILTLTNPLGGSRLEKTQAEEKAEPPRSEKLAESHNEELISSSAMATSAKALTRLAQTSKSLPSKKAILAEQRNLTLDQLIQDMVRPLIKEWIDTHLPTLVEEMVAKEIKRITKHLE